MAHDVFISHSSRDKAVADAACARLEQAGHRCWMAPRDILPGKEWGESIVEGIRNARIFVLIFSDHANRSPQVLREIERAVSAGLIIVPFRIEDVLPTKSLEYFMSAPHWLDALTPPMEKHIAYLADVVSALLDGSSPPAAPPPAAARAPARSRRWVIGAGAGLAVAGGAWFLWRRRPAPMLLDFSAVRTDRAPGHRLAAAPNLHEAAVPIQVVDAKPAGSHLLFVANSELYGGNAVRPTISETLLMLDVPEVVPSSFTLRFAAPLAEFGFTVPALYAASASGIIFPGFRAVAQDARGGLLDQVGRALRRSFQDVAAETIVLRAPGREGIGQVVFHSDPERIAAFRSLLIEGMTYRPMAG